MEQIDYIPNDDDTITRLRETEASKKDNAVARIYNEFRYTKRGSELYSRNIFEYYREARLEIEKELDKLRLNGQIKPEQAKQGQVELQVKLKEGKKEIKSGGIFARTSLVTKSEIEEKWRNEWSLRFTRFK